MVRPILNPKLPISEAKRYGVAVLLSSIAFLLRWAIDPIIGDALYYVTAFPAVATAVWYGGPRAGIAATLVSLIWATYFFTPPRWSFDLSIPRSFFGAAAFICSACVIVALGHALQRSRARSLGAEHELRELMDSLPVLISFITPDFRYRLNNKAYEDWFDIKQSELLDRPLPEILGAPAFAKIRPRLEKALQGEEVTFRDFLPYTRRGGRWVNVIYRPRRNEAGEITGVVALVADISEQQRAEEEVQKREHEFRAMFELNATGTALCDLETGRLTRVNGKFREMLGFNEEELLTRSLSDLTHPDDRARDREVFRAALQSRAPQWESELRFVRKDGREVWALMRGTILRDEKGRATRTITSVVDLTASREIQQALQESEARLRFALDAGHFGAWEWNIDQDKVIWSDRLYQIHGLKPEEFNGRSDGFRRLVHPDDQAKVAHAIEQSLNGTSNYEIDFRAVRPNGEVVWIWTSATLFRRDGRPARMIGITSDITERKRAEEMLRSQAHHLEDLVRERTARLQEVIAELEGFSYTIAHDLRAPLRSMHGFASILEEEYGSRLEEEGRGYLQRITASAQRMDMLINDVLAYSVITRQELILQKIEPAELLPAIIDGNPDLQEPAASVTLLGTIPPVLGSPALFTQTFSNLLGNAVKFVRPGEKPRVEISARLNKDTVTIAVRDNGIGIAAEHHERVFGLFNRLHKEYSGTGIGLAIVKRAVERMNGRVGLESEPGNGSCFWVELQRADSPASSNSHSAAA